MRFVDFSESKNLINDIGVRKRYRRRYNTSCVKVKIIIIKHLMDTSDDA